MLIISLSQHRAIAQQHPHLAKPLEELLLKAQTFAPGRTNMPNGAYVNAEEYLTKPSNANGFEAHRKYIDIQCLSSGIEKIMVAPISCATPTQHYNEERDVAFFQCNDADKVSEIVLTPGMAAVFFPADAHMPCLVAGEEATTVRKLVYKIPVK